MPSKPRGVRAWMPNGAFPDRGQRWLWADRKMLFTWNSRTFAPCDKRLMDLAGHPDLHELAPAEAKKLNAARLKAAKGRKP